MRKIMRSLLASLGFRSIDEAEDGAAAIEAFRNVVHDVVLLDQVMPIVDGVELTRLLRAKTSPNRFVSIIMVTGLANQKQIQEALKAGVHEFLAKPVSLRQLNDKLANIVVNPRNFIDGPTYFGPEPRRAVGSFVPEKIEGKVVVPPTDLSMKVNVLR